MCSTGFGYREWAGDSIRPVWKDRKNRTCPRPHSLRPKKGVELAVRDPLEKDREKAIVYVLRVDRNRAPKERAVAPRSYYFI